MIKWMLYFMLTQMDVQLCIYLYHALNKLISWEDYKMLRNMQQTYTQGNKVT